MTIDLILFLLLALIAVASAVSMVASRNTVYSALFLVLNFGTIALFFLLLGGPFIAMTQITVYTGAIMVLFLFVIMLLGVERLSPEESTPWQRPLAIGFGLLPPDFLVAIHLGRVSIHLVTNYREGQALAFRFGPIVRV